MPPKTKGSEVSMWWDNDEYRDEDDDKDHEEGDDDEDGDNGQYDDVENGFPDAPKDTRLFQYDGIMMYTIKCHLPYIHTNVDPLMLGRTF